MMKWRFTSAAMLCVLMKTPQCIAQLRASIQPENPIFNEEPMPMHQRFLLEQKWYNSLSSDVMVSSNDLHDNEPDKSDESFADKIMLEYKRQLDVLSSSWWVRLPEGDRQPETRRAHSATVFEILKERHDNNHDTNPAPAAGPDSTSKPELEPESQPEPDPEPQPEQEIDPEAEVIETPPSTDQDETDEGVEMDAESSVKEDGDQSQNSNTDPSNNTETTVTPDSDSVPAGKNTVSTPENEEPTSAGDADSTPGSSSTTPASPSPGTRNLSKTQEYMVVTGGFTDSDWKTFPVWAYDMTSATTADDGRWFELTPPDSFSNSNICLSNVTIPGIEHSQPCAPMSRVGHISTVRNGELYVFGGLQYNEHAGVFFMEQEPFMYKMRLSEEDFQGRDYENYDGDFNADQLNEEKMRWTRWTPKVNEPPKDMKSAQTDDLEFTVNRGEVRGGYWEKGDKLVIYGGLHVREYKTGTGHSQQADTTLGDVWAYDFKTDTWEMMASTWGPSGYGSLDHPGERTSHAATIVGDELVVYGGLRKVDTYLWDGSTVWSQLDDIWVFDLNLLTWKLRPMAESMGRAYHAVVGWQLPDRDGAILAAFGGYKTMMDPVDNQQISYVYDDTMVSMPQVQNTSQPSVWFLASYNGMQPETISTRLEHSAVLSREYGNMFVWGGRYRLTSEISGVWSLNIAGPGSTVEYMVRSEDSEIENAGLAYVILLTVMMMSMMFTYICGIIHRRAEQNEAAMNMDALNADPTLGGTVFGRNGLRQDVIDTLPIKKYQNENANDSEQGAGNTQSSNNEETNEEAASPDFNFDDDDNCCPICLVEYEVGDDMRCLPCGHEFHKSCVDPWLMNNASCPACRHSLSNLAQPTTSADFAAAIRATISARMRPTPTPAENDRARNQVPPRSSTISPPTSPRSQEEGIAPGARGLQNLRRMVANRRRRRHGNLTSVPSNESASSDNSSRRYSSDSGDSIGELELSYSSSFDDLDSRSSSFESDDVPLEGRPRRMRISRSDRQRMMRSRGGRRNRRVRGTARSPLNAPLQPSDASIV